MHPYNFFPQILVSKLTSISHDIIHHTIIGTFLYLPLQSLTSKIVSILILEHAALYYASSSRPDLDEALDRAYSQYRASNTHSAIMEQFSVPPETYSISQLTEFILENRL